VLQLEIAQTTLPLVADWVLLPTFCGATFGVTGTLVEILGLMMPGAVLEVLMTEGRDPFGELDLHLFGQ
jgi:hypothetical protein